MKTQEEIEQLANDYVNHEPKNAKELRDVNLIKMGYINAYTQCQEDMAKLTFVPGLDKETLDELFDLHDSDDFIQEASDKKYTEEDMQICWNTAILVFAKNRPILFKDYIKL
jgi:hypothetical protein